MTKNDPPSMPSGSSVLVEAGARESTERVGRDPRSRLAYLDGNDDIVFSNARRDVENALSPLPPTERAEVLQDVHRKVTLMDETTRGRVSSPAVDLLEHRAHLSTRIDILDEENKLVDENLNRLHAERDALLREMENECRNAGSTKDQRNWILELLLGLVPNVSDRSLALIINGLTKSGSDTAWRNIVRGALDEAMLFAAKKTGHEREAIASRIAHARIGLSIGFGGAPKDRNPLREPRRAAIAWGAWGLYVYGSGAEACVAIDEVMAASCKDADLKNIATVEGFSLWATRWAACGFPAIAPTHRLAAALMATSLPVDLVPDVVFPWDTFVIDIPDGLVQAESVGAIADVTSSDGSGNAPLSKLDFDFRISTMVLMRHPRPEGRCYALSIALTPGGIFGTWEFDDLSALLDTGNRDVFTAVSKIHLSQEPGSASARLLEMLGRLALGCLVEMDSDERKTELRQRTTERSKTSGKERDGKPRAPGAWVFHLTRNVKVDARRYVGAYIRDGGRSPSVRYLVRGHHKRQVCGVGRTNRKWIHVEPYWKGDDTLPIAVREHVLAEKDEEGGGR